MANRYWVGGTGTWDTTTTTNWSAASALSFTASRSGTTLTTVGSPALVIGMTVRDATNTSIGTITGGSGNTWTMNTSGTVASQTMKAATAGAAVPTAADSVFFDANSSGTAAYTVTMTGAILCLDITVSALTPTFATGTSPTLAVSGSMTLAAGMTWNATGAITFNATTTGKTITTNGVSIPANMTLNGVGGAWTLGSALSVSGQFTLTAGTISLSTFSLTCSLLSSTNTNTRNMTFGTGAKIFVSGASATAIDIGTATNFTITGTPIFGLTNVSTSGFNFGGSAQGYWVEANTISLSFGSAGSTAGLYVTNTSSFSLISNVKDVNLTGFTGSLLIGSTNVFGNFTFASGVTYPSTTSFINFSSTSGTKTITTNGVSLDSQFNFSGVGGTWQLQDNFSTGSTRQVSLTNGTLNLNGKTLSCGSFYSSFATARTLAFGLGAISCSGAYTSAVDIGTGTNLTITGTPVFALTNTTQSGASFGSSAQGYWTEANTLPLSIGSSGSSAGIYVTNTSTLNISGYFKDIIFTGFTGALSAATTTCYGNLALASAMTISSFLIIFAATSGTKTVTSNGKSLPSNVTFNGVGGTWQLQDAMSTSGSVTLTNGTLNLNNQTLTAGSFSSNNSNSRTLAFGTGNVTLSGSGTVWSTPTVTNFNITGTSVVNVANLSASNATVQPGTPAEANAISVNVTSGSAPFTLVNATILGLNFTGYSGAATGSGNSYFYGNLVFSPTMTFTSQLISWNMTPSSGTKTISSNGVAFSFTLGISGAGAVKLNDALTMSAKNVLHSAGTFDLNGKTLTCNSYSGSSTGNLTFNGGTAICLNSFSAASTFTTTAGTGTGTISLTNASPNTFSGGGIVYNCTLNLGGSGQVSITGANNFYNITNTVQPVTVSFPASTTNTFSSFSLLGNAGNLVSIISSVSGTQATVSKSSGVVSGDYLSIKDSAAIGGAAWYAGANSTNVSNNTGWIFTAPPGGYAGNFFSFLTN